MHFRNVLIIKPGAIGDLLHLTPVLRALKGLNPATSITILVGSRVTASLFENNPDVSEAIVFDKKGEHRSLTGLLSLRRLLRERDFDLVLNFQRSNLKAWLLASAAFPCRCLVYRKARGRVVHAVVNHLETLAPLGIDPHAADRRLHFFPSPQDETFADRELRTRGLAGATVIAFNPGTAHAVKCWPVERFAELGDRLKEELGVEIVILGSAGERALAEGIMARMRHSAHDLTGCSLGELGALLERSALLVTGDTGPMHVASAVGTRVVALHGPTSPERSGPVGEGHRIVMHREFCCCPCNSFKCKNRVFRECMERITVEEVFFAVKEMLAERGNNA